MVNGREAQRSGVSRIKRSAGPIGSTASRNAYDELLSEFALAHVEGSATVTAYARDDLREKRRQVMQAWADCISG